MRYKYYIKRYKKPLNVDFERITAGEFTRVRQENIDLFVKYCKSRKKNIKLISDTNPSNTKNKILIIRESLRTYDKNWKEIKRKPGLWTLLAIGSIIIGAVITVLVDAFRTGISGGSLQWICTAIWVSGIIAILIIASYRENK